MMNMQFLVMTYPVAMVWECLEVFSQHANLMSGVQPSLPLLKACKACLNWKAEAWDHVTEQKRFELLRRGDDASQRAGSSHSSVIRVC